jgi:hypothetical protein
MMAEALNTANWVMLFFSTICGISQRFPDLGVSKRCSCPPRLSPAFALERETTTLPPAGKLELCSANGRVRKREVVVITHVLYPI